MSSFLLTRPFTEKPSDALEPVFAHKQLRNCVCWWPFLVQDYRELLEGRDANLSGPTATIFPSIAHPVGSVVEFLNTPSNRALQTNLVDSRVSVPNTASAITLSLLVNLTSVGAVGSSNGVGLMLKGQTAGSTFYEWGLSVEGGPVWCRTSGGNNGGVGNLSTGRWYRITHVWDAGNAGAQHITYINDQKFVASNTNLSNNSLTWPVFIGTCAGGLALAGVCADARIYQGALTDAEAFDIYHHPWAPFERRVFIPVSVGAGDFPLNIQDLAHAHPVDAPAVGGNYTLSLGDLTHAHPVDQCAVTLVGAAEILDIDKLTHQHPLDAPILVDGQLLDIDEMSHAHPIDSPTLGLPPITISIDDLVHAHPVDAPVVSGGYPLIINDLTHAHPVDEVAVAALEGTRTALVGETGSWDADAGAVLSNTNGVDITNWHVIEIVFDGANTILTVDGVEVTGNAGLRALTALTVGAEKDGSNRFQGILGELRVYDGEVDAATRAQIRAELQQKWITG